MATIKDVAMVTTMLSAAYPNWNVNEYTTQVYFEDLQDLPSDLLLLAAKHCRTNPTRDQRFAPSAGEIRAAAMDIKRQAQGVPSALEAWGELFRVPTNERTKWVEDDAQGNPVIVTAPYQWSHPLPKKVAYLLGFPKFPDWNSESYERTTYLKVYEIELQAWLKADNQIPEINEFITASHAKALPMGTALTQLSKKMSK
jgi:hypothetical protein